MSSLGRLVELADKVLSEEELLRALFSANLFEYLIAREVWNKRHPDQPITSQPHLEWKCLNCHRHGVVPLSIPEGRVPTAREALEILLYAHARALVAHDATSPTCENRKLQVRPLY